MQFYVTAPFFAGLIFVTARRIGVLPIVGTAIAIGLIYRVTSARIAADNGATWVVAIYCPLLGNLDIFVTGMATAYFVQAKRVEWPRLLHGLLLCGILYVSAAICWSKLLGSTDASNLLYGLRYYSPTIFALTTAAIIVLLENAVQHPTDAISRFLVTATQKVGILTYAIYLWHEPIFLAYAKSIHRPISPLDTLSALVVTSVSVLAFSWITWTAIEKPIDNLRI
jgi:peptidoglycan/LPS O-acetylase OafA/YrhL